MFHLHCLFGFLCPAANLIPTAISIITPHLTFSSSVCMQERIYAVIIFVTLPPTLPPDTHIQGSQYLFELDQKALGSWKEGASMTRGEPKRFHLKNLNLLKSSLVHIYACHFLATHQISFSFLFILS